MKNKQAVKEYSGSPLLYPKFCTVGTFRLRYLPCKKKNRRFECLTRFLCYFISFIVSSKEMYPFERSQTDKCECRLIALEAKDFEMQVFQ